MIWLCSSAFIKVQNNNKFGVFKTGFSVFRALNIYVCGIECPCKGLGVWFDQCVRTLYCVTREEAVVGRWRGEVLERAGWSIHQGQVHWRRLVSTYHHRGLGYTKQCRHDSPASSGVGRLLGRFYGGGGNWGLGTCHPQRKKNCKLQIVAIDYRYII